MHWPIRVCVRIVRKSLLSLRLGLAVQAFSQQWIVLVIYLGLGALTGYWADRLLRYRVDYWFPLGPVHFDALPPWHLEGSLWVKVLEKTKLGYSKGVVGLKELALDRQNLLTDVHRLVSDPVIKSQGNKAVNSILRAGRYFFPRIFRNAVLETWPRSLFLAIVVKSLAENKQFRDAARSTWLLPVYSQSSSMRSFMMYFFVVDKPEVADFKEALEKEADEHGDVVICGRGYLGRRSTAPVSCALDNIYDLSSPDYILLASDRTFIDLPSTLMWLAAKQEHFHCYTQLRDPWIGGMVLSGPLAGKVREVVSSSKSRLSTTHLSVKDMALTVAQTLTSLPAAELCPNGGQRPGELSCSQPIPLFLHLQTVPSLFALMKRLSPGSMACPVTKIDLKTAPGIVELLLKFFGYSDNTKERS